jgi:hypothetical protein
MRSVSCQVPMMVKSARAMAATPSLGQPDILILNLYGQRGRCISSWNSWVRLAQMSSVSMQEYSQRAGPTQQLMVRSAEPEPPRSNPASVSSSKQGCRLLVLVPSSMTSPVEPWKLVRPLPYFSQISQILRRASVV